MTKDTETLGLVPQKENFNYNRYANYVMDSWNYLESPMTKSRSHQTEDMTTLSMLYEQCKNLKDHKMSPCNGSSVYKPTERTLSNSSPELVSLETPPSITKMLSDKIPSSLHLEALTSPVCSPAEQSVSLPVSVAPAASDVYATLTTASVLADAHDKQDLNGIFDSLPLQKWPAGAFPEANAEALPYSDPFSEEPSSPVYSDSYTGSSPPKGYGSEFQFTLGAPPATPPKPCKLPTVYLNKGQFYPITLHGIDSTAGLAVATVKTVVMAVFENDNRTPEAQLRCWNHWHARQPTIKQRVIDRWELHMHARARTVSGEPSLTP